MMGIFDFFKRKADAEPLQEPATEETADDTIDESVEASAAWDLVHHDLRLMMMGRPLMMINYLNGEKRDEVLDILFTNKVTMAGLKLPFNAQDVKVHLDTIRGFRSVVFEFPEPQSLDDPYFAALILNPNDIGDPTEDDVELPSRYFYLSKNDTSRDDPPALLWEWRGEKAKIVVDVSQTSIVSFVSAVLGQIESTD